MRAKLVETALMAALLWMGLAVPTARAARRQKKILPSWSEIGKAAVDTILKDVPEHLVKPLREQQDESDSGALFGTASEPAINQLSMVDISDESLDCEYVVNKLLLNITQFKSIFYFLVNGWYLGQLGDYSSCRTFTNNGQYVLATIKGDYTADYTFTRGSYGKYMGWSTQMGLCVPKQCKLENITNAIEPLLLRYATEAHWENPTVEYQFSWEYEHDTARSFDTGKIVGVSVFAACLLIVTCGSCVELSSIGDDPEFDKEVLNELNRFKSTDQYEAVIMQQKLPWARYFVAVSAIRNINKMNLKPYQMRKEMESPFLDRKHIKNLSVFNGIKALACFYVILASSFLFTWYAYLADPSQMTNFKNSYAFLIIYCVYFTVPVLFMTAGFLQTFSFLQQRPEEMFTAKNLAKYYAWRMFKFVPLLGMVLLFSMCVFPFLGSGPIWNYYETTMAPCSTYWWTVLVQVNNIVPTGGFDDKCMPWAWFIPALTQLSLLLPLFVAVYQALMPNRSYMRIFAATILVLSCLLAGSLTLFFNEGAMPVSIRDVNSQTAQVNKLTKPDFTFYNDVFMLSPFHLGSYFGGFCLAIIYRRFLSDSELNKMAELENGRGVNITRASRFFILLNENARVRYTGYIVGALLILGTCSWVYPFMSNADGMPNWFAALFSFAAPTLFLMGFSCFLLPALVGKAALFREVMSCGMFLIVSNLAATMCLVGPQICLWYYLSSGHTLDISWYVTQYYFDSNAVFTFLISIIVAATSDKPFYSLMHLQQDAKAAEQDDRHSIAPFKASSVLLSASQVTGTTVRYVDVPEDGQSFRGGVSSRFLGGPVGATRLSQSRQERERVQFDPAAPQPLEGNTPAPGQLIASGSLPNAHTGLKGKQSPSESSNRITALDDMLHDTMMRQGSTRADTNLFRETDRRQ